MIADAYDAFLLDLDGVLYRGDHPCPARLLRSLRFAMLGKRLAFVTNNSSRPPEAVVAHLAASVDVAQTLPRSRPRRSRPPRCSLAAA